MSVITCIQSADVNIKQKATVVTATFTYSFSSTFRPFTRSTQAWVSKSIVSTWIDNIVRTLLLELLPVDDSVSTLLLTQQLFFKLLAYGMLTMSL